MKCVKLIHFTCIILHCWVSWIQRNFSSFYVTFIWVKIQTQNIVVALIFNQKLIDISIYNFTFFKKPLLDSEKIPIHHFKSFSIANWGTYITQTCKLNLLQNYWCKTPTWSTLFWYLKSILNAFVIRRNNLRLFLKAIILLI